jgi:hypothetical protein
VNRNRFTGGEPAHVKEAAAAAHQHVKVPRSIQRDRADIHPASAEDPHMQQVPEMDVD